MESLGPFQGGEWDSFNIFFSNPEHYSMINNLDHYISSKNFDDFNEETLQSFCMNPEVDTTYAPMCDSSICPPAGLHANDGGNILGMSNFILDSSSDLSHIPLTTEIPFVPKFKDPEMEQAVCLNVGDIGNSSCSMLEEYTIPGKEMHPKRKFGKSDRGVVDNYSSDFLEMPMKKHRIANYASMNKSNLGLKNPQKLNDSGLKNSSGTSSEDSLSANHMGEVTLDSGECANAYFNRNTRARRGSATDPQSLYARRRRERVNQRLRILQNLIPNGTKVDISTMLEEAVHYVKFLQLQIKLLSSDELWMYAAAAYNGFNIGLNQIS